LFLHILRFLSHSLKQNFFAKQKQEKLLERGKVLPDDFGENFKVFLSLIQSQLHRSKDFLFPRHISLEGVICNERSVNFAPAMGDL